uniref:Uncharacterized protein n=3 Tax=Oryza TaxID=4527 RepID=A0A0D3G3N5_9ORYZ
MASMRHWRQRYVVLVNGEFLAARSLPGSPIQFVLGFSPRIPPLLNVGDMTKTNTYLGGYYG